MIRRVSLATGLSILGVTLGCELPPAHGDANALIVGASPELWTQVQEVFLQAMEPTIQTVRNERPFRITHQDPTDLRDWGLLNQFRQVLVLGVEGEAWIDEALAVVEGPVAPAPTVLQMLNVWSRGQQVSVLLLPRTGQVEAGAPVGRGTPRDSRRTVSLLRGQSDVHLRRRPGARGFARRECRVLAAASIVYQYSERNSVFRFRNDNPSPAELIREVSISWQSPFQRLNSPLRT